MQFQDTRLYEFGRWLIGIALGFAMLALFQVLFPTLQHDAALMQKEHELSQQISTMIQEINSFTAEQRDSFIALEQEYANTLGLENYADRIRKLHFYLWIIGLMLLRLSIDVKHPILRLIMAIMGMVVLLTAIFFQVFEQGVVTLVLIPWIIFGVCALVWHYWCKKQVNPNRYIAVQVVAAGSLALALFCSGSAIYRHFINSIYREEPAIVELREKRKHIVQEQQELLRKSELSEDEKQRYIDLEKERIIAGTAINELDATKENQHAIKAYARGQEHARPYLFIGYTLLAFLCLALGIIIRKPLYASFGFIFGAFLVSSLLMSLGLGYSWVVYCIMAVMLGVAMCFLYRQPRQTT